MTNEAKPAGPMVFVGTALVIGLILSISTSAADFMCLPDYVPPAKGNKLDGFIGPLKMAVSHPMLFLPLLVGFFVIALAVTTFPMLFKDGSRGRITSVFGTVLLLLGGVGWGVYQISATPCEASWQGILTLMQIATGVLLWCAVVLLTFRKDRRGL